MEKYLRLYAEPEASALDGIPSGAWSHVLVIPACNETPDLLRPPPRSEGRVLLVLVVNEPLSAPLKVSGANQVLADAVQGQLDLVWQSAISGGKDQVMGPMQLFHDRNTSRDVLLVDRFNEGFQLPPKGGVGHARKIGADLATALIHQGLVTSPWIHCSDGDVELPQTYFESVRQMAESASDCAALVYPFEHVPQPGGEPEVLQATKLYELSLHYYVAGMRFAGSPYAFHTIGSTMTVNAHHYARVRGFQRREAGEDFYLLNKLAKVGGVCELKSHPTCLPICIQARRSDRVPFGTGAAVNTITALADPLHEYLFYHPDVFELLRCWLQCWPEMWDKDSKELSNLISLASLDHLSTDERGRLVRALQEINAEKALEHAFRQSKDPDQFVRHMHTWFDAFKTLKMIHSLRNQGYTSVDYPALAAHPGFSNLLDRDQGLQDFCQSLGRWIRI